MSEGNRRYRTTPLEAFFIILLLLGVVFVIYATGRTFGVEAGRNEVTAREHYDAAKENRLQACANLNGAALTQCVIEAIESAQNQSESRRDLYAQQDMAKFAFGTLIASSFTFLITALGVFWVKRTLDETSRAVGAAYEATAVTRRIGEVQASAYFDIQHLAIILNSSSPHVHLNFFNSGQTPAHNVMAKVSLFWGESHHSRYFSKYQSESAFFNVVAPSQPKGGKFGSSAERLQEWLYSYDSQPGTLFARVQIQFTDAFGLEKSNRFHYVTDLRATDVFDAQFDFISDPHPPYY